MSQISVVAKITAQSGKRDELATALGELIDAAHGEPGTIHYILNADAKDADVLWMWELYASQKSLDAHMGSAVFTGLGPKVGHLFGAAPELNFCSPVTGKGL